MDSYRIPSLGFGSRSLTNSTVEVIDTGLPASRQDAISRRRLEVLLAAVLSIGLISASSAIAWQAGSYLLPRVDLESLRPLFIEPYWFHLKPEPVERLAYLTAVVVTYPATVLSIWIARRLVGNRLSEVSQFILLAALSSSLFIFAAASSTFSHVVSGPPRVVGTQKTLTILLAAGCLSAALLFVLLRLPASRAESVLLRRTEGYSPIIIFAIVLAALAQRIRSADMIAGDGHFEAVFYSVSQVMAGKTLLADLPAQYGLYAEILAPIWWFAGRSVLAFSLTMVALQLIATVCVVTVSRHLIRLEWLYIVSSLSLIWLLGSLWSTAFITVKGSEYFQIWPLRFLFPAVATYWFLRMSENSCSTWRVLGAGIISGLAVAWNLDSGVPVAGAFIAYFVTRLIFLSTRREDLQKLALLLVSSATTLSLFLVYLDMKSEGAVDLESWFRYQSVFYATGFGMLPMKSWDAWIAVYGLYIVGLVTSLYGCATKSYTVRLQTLTFLSVLGIGLFTYFEGRSHPKTLAFVCWPAVLIAFVMADLLLKAARSSRSRWSIGWFALPAVTLAVSLSVAWVLSVPTLLSVSYETLRKIALMQTSKTDRAVEFITQKVGRDPSAAIIAHAQGSYFAQSGLASAVPGPGIFEIVLQEDVEAMMRFLEEHPVSHVFVQTRREADRPPIYDALLPPYQDLLEQYEIEDRSETLLYLVPKRERGDSSLGRERD